MPRFLVTRDPSTGDRDGVRLSTLHNQVDPDADPPITLRDVIRPLIANKQWIVLSGDTVADVRAQILTFLSGSHSRQALLNRFRNRYASGEFDLDFLTTGPDGVTWPEQ